MDLEGNEKFQKRKFAYFSQKMRGKGSFKPISIFVGLPPSGAFPVGKIPPPKKILFLRFFTHGPKKTPLSGNFWTPKVTIFSYPN